MNRTLIREINNNIGQLVKIEGWVSRIRKLGKIAFLILRDRSGSIQCVINTKQININDFKIESVVEIIGEAVKNEKEEIQVKELNVINKVKEDLPIEINKDILDVHLDTLLNNRVLSLRHKTINSIFKIQACLSDGFREFLKENDFTEIFSPKIVGEGAEGGTELFELQYFDKKAYLAQSPQFYKQMMVAAGYERVFEIGHVYRAEEHNTNRHLNEYVSLDLEVGFIQDERELMDFETKLLKSMIEKIKIECEKEILILNAKLPKIKGKIPSMKLSEAIKVLKEVYDKNDLEEDIDPEGEKLISKYVKEKYNSDFVFLTDYPIKKRPMYTMPKGKKVTHSFDLIFRGLEITTGGQRIHDYEMLKRSFENKGINSNAFKDYLKVFEYGMPPHGGLAIGLERLTARILGYKNIRETTLFPRDRDRITP